MITFSDTDKSFELDGELLKLMTNYIFNVDHSNTQDRKLIYEFKKEMKFDIKKVGRPSTGDKSVLKILIESSAFMASGISTIFSSEILNELCDRLKFLLQEKRAGIDFGLINEEIVAIVDKLLEYQSLSKKQHKILLLKCSN